MLVDEHFYCGIHVINFCRAQARTRDERMSCGGDRSRRRFHGTNRFDMDTISEGSSAKVDARGGNRTGNLSNSTHGIILMLFLPAEKTISIATGRSGCQGTSLAILLAKVSWT